ncbi:MAG: TetR/AcrR family transcriptional regulator [Flavobacteriales bacterium]|nr:TetR/AcrR family transcriptional regulator [Flavobacteriales bacterium]
MNPREKILATALSAFNERGVENVGMRDLALLAGMRPGNLTYYFPTKGHLIGALTQQLRELNNQTIVNHPDLDIPAVVSMFRKSMQNQSEFRFIFKSFVHLVETYEEVSDPYRQSEKKRFATLDKIVSTLVHRGHLRQITPEEQQYLVGALGMINRFWIAEAAVTFRRLSLKKQQEIYSRRIEMLLISFQSAPVHASD